MANKIFVSYKYLDSLVQALPNESATTARHYLDEIEKLLGVGDHIFKGENDDEDMGTLADSTIGSKLGDKIFDSSVTIVLVSKGMKNASLETDQWIPWEISYSLKEQSREGGKSKTNAVLAVVIPDENGSYDYYMTSNPTCDSISYHTSKLFQILRENMFNHKKRDESIRECNGTKIYEGRPSFIHSVKWEHFIIHINTYINIALEIRQNIDQYELVKTVK